MNTLTNLALIACLLTSTSVFATAAPHVHQHDNASPQTPLSEAGDEAYEFI